DIEAEVEIAPSQAPNYRVRPDTRAVEEAVKLLSSAERPLMLIGDRIAQSGAMDETVALAELLGAPVNALSYSEVNFPTSHPLYQGALNTSWGTPRLRKMLQDADAVLVVGGDLVRQLAATPEPLVPPGCRIVHVDSSAWEIEKSFPVAAGVWADIKESLVELTSALSEGLSPGLKRAASARTDAMRQAKAQQKAAFQQRAHEALKQTPMGVEGLMATLAETLPKDAIVTAEAPTSTDAMMQAIPFDKPGDFFGSRGGGLGWGMPGPVGVKLAAPQRPVVALVGDGAAMYTIQALWTAARYAIPVTYVVCNNRTYKILKEGMARYLAPEGRESKYIGFDFYERPLNLARIAEGFGIPGHRVERAEELRPALEAALSAGTTAVVDVSIAEELRPQALAQDWLAWYRS
ncbi:MAG: thiamine pyrophosphate-dependent enzyme, partial [Chloroflexota bacterium]|nr:thiamine pyrophosphate-dependent enzyme [Chloroflexota bacterium]